VTAAIETHTVGVFSQAEWELWMAEAGFSVETVREQTDEDREPRFFFLGTRD